MALHKVSVEFSLSAITIKSKMDCPKDDIEEEFPMSRLLLSGLPSNIVIINKGKWALAEKCTFFVNATLKIIIIIMHIDLILHHLNLSDITQIVFKLQRHNLLMMR